MSLAETSARPEDASSGVAGKPAEPGRGCHHISEKDFHELGVGDHIWVTFEDDGEYYKCVIDEKKTDFTFDITYEAEGETEEDVSLDRVYLAPPAEASTGRDPGTSAPVTAAREPECAAVVAAEGAGDAAPAEAKDREPAGTQGALPEPGSAAAPAPAASGHGAAPGAGQASSALSGAPARHISEAEFQQLAVGDKIWVTFDDDGEYYRCTIDAVNWDLTCNITYEEGEETEDDVTFDRMFLAPPAKAGAPGTQVPSAACGPPAPGEGTAAEACGTRAEADPVGGTCAPPAEAQCAPQEGAGAPMEVGGVQGPAAAEERSEAAGSAAAGAIERVAGEAPADGGLVRISRDAFLKLEVGAHIAVTYEDDGKFYNCTIDELDKSALTCNVTYEGEEEEEEEVSLDRVYVAKPQAPVSDAPAHAVAAAHSGVGLKDTLSQAATNSESVNHEGKACNSRGDDTSSIAMVQPSEANVEAMEVDVPNTSAIVESKGCSSGSDSTSSVPMVQPLQADVEAIKADVSNTGPSVEGSGCHNSSDDTSSLTMVQPLRAEVEAMEVDACNSSAAVEGKGCSGGSDNTSSPTVVQPLQAEVGAMEVDACNSSGAVEGKGCSGGSDNTSIPARAQPLQAEVGAMEVDVPKPDGGISREVFRKLDIGWRMLVAREDGGKHHSCVIEKINRRTLSCDVTYDDDGVEEDGVGIGRISAVVAPPSCEEPSGCEPSSPSASKAQPGSPGAADGHQVVDPDGHGNDVPPVSAHPSSPGVADGHHVADQDGHGNGVPPVSAHPSSPGAADGHHVADQDSHGNDVPPVSAHPSCPGAADGHEVVEQDGHGNDVPPARAHPDNNDAERHQVMEQDDRGNEVPPGQSSLPSPASPKPGRDTGPQAGAVYFVAVDAKGGHAPQPFCMRGDQPLKHLLGCYASFRGLAADGVLGMQMSTPSHGALDSERTVASYSFSNEERVTFSAPSAEAAAARLAEAKEPDSGARSKPETNRTGVLSLLSDLVSAPEASTRRACPAGKQEAHGGEAPSAVKGTDDIQACGGSAAEVRKKPMAPALVFINENRAEISKRDDCASRADIYRKGAELYKALPAEERSKREKKYEEDTRKYQAWASTDEGKAALAQAKEKSRAKKDAKAAKGGRPEAPAVVSDRMRTSAVRRGPAKGWVVTACLQEAGTVHWQIAPPKGGQAYCTFDEVKRHGSKAVYNQIYTTVRPELLQQIHEQRMAREGLRETTPQKASAPAPLQMVGPITPPKQALASAAKAPVKDAVDKSASSTKRPGKARLPAVEEPPRKVAAGARQPPGAGAPSVMATQAFRTSSASSSACETWACTCLGHLRRHPRCVFSNGQQPLLIQLGDRLLVGRNDTCDVVLDSDRTPGMISRSHALLQRENGLFNVTDHQSVNGVLVNGETAVAKHPLRQGDVITFGVPTPNPEFDYIFEERPAKKRRACEMATQVFRAP